jgi:hypothetical protein
MPFNPAAFSPFAPNPLPLLSSWRPKPICLVLSSRSDARLVVELFLKRFETNGGGGEVNTGRTSCETLGSTEEPSFQEVRERLYFPFSRKMRPCNIGWLGCDGAEGHSTAYQEDVQAANGEYEER